MKTKCEICNTETEVQKISHCGQTFLTCEDCIPVLEYMINKLEVEADALVYNRLNDWREVLKDELQ